MKDKIVKKIKDFLRRFDIYSFDDAFVCGSLLSFAIMFLAAILNIALDRMGIRDEQISFMVIRICSIFLFILIALKIIQGILIFLNALQEDIKEGTQLYIKHMDLLSNGE